jgi:hypothetical protein
MSEKFLVSNLTKLRKLSDTQLKMKKIETKYGPLNDMK